MLPVVFLSDKIICAIFLMSGGEKMATTSIKKNFVINSKKSALEIASQLIDVEKSVMPTLNRPRISRSVTSDQIISYFSKSNNKPDRR